MQGNRFTVLVFVLGMQVVEAVVLGIALKVLWGWYMVSTFSLPAINVGQAIGICLTVGLITRQYVPKSEEPEETLINAFEDNIMTAIGALALGGVIHMMIS